MIDVMLVLLVIFMVVVPALPDGFTATPPGARSVALVTERGPAASAAAAR